MMLIGVNKTRLSYGLFKQVILKLSLKPTSQVFELELLFSYEFPSYCKKGEFLAEIALNVVLTSAILTFVLWVSKSNPTLGGFIVSLPISTLIVLAFSKIENQNPGSSFMLAKSIFVAVPTTMLFFVPFLLADKLKLPFWTSYISGIALLAVAYWIHGWIAGQWFA